jgi:phenylacetate-CoA ligase
LKELLGKRKIKLLRSYTQYLYTIASELRQRGYRYNVKSIMTTAEPLFPEHRVLFQEVFGAEVFDQYGCGEIGGIAFECDHHEGLHVTEERVILETGETGELIITDLDNLALPLIRYSNADEAEYASIDVVAVERVN